MDLPLELPCGQCIGCRIDKSQAWALRCVHEASQHERNSFVTLTYEDAELPDDLGLDVRDFQLFCKRLRKYVGPFRFFHCGEYGPENLRPHYHALLFGVDFHEDRVPLRSAGSHVLYRSDLLDRAWRKGFASIGNLTFQSAAYVARYCMKKVTGERAASHYERVDARTGEVFRVRPEYVTMSRRPGIGAEWFEKYHKDVYPDDEVVHDGRKFRPPRFYDSLLERSSPIALESVKARRRKTVEARREALTPDRLRAKESILESRLGRLKRKI